MSKHIYELFKHTFYIGEPSVDIYACQNKSLNDYQVINSENNFHLLIVVCIYSLSNRILFSSCFCKNSCCNVLFSPSVKVYGARKPDECAFDASNCVVAQNFRTRTELTDSFFPLSFENRSKP